MLLANAGRRGSHYAVAQGLSRHIPQEPKRILIQRLRRIAALVYEGGSSVFGRRPSLRLLVRLVVQLRTLTKNFPGALRLTLAATSAKEWAASSTRIAFSAFSMT